MIRVVHAVAAAVAVITDEPAISLEFEVTFVSIFAEFTGGVTLVTCVMGVGNHNNGTAGICTSDLVDSVCSFAASVDTQGDVLGTWGNSDTVDVGLPKTVIECFIALPFLGLELLADLVLASSLWVPFGGSVMYCVPHELFQSLDSS